MAATAGGTALVSSAPAGKDSAIIQEGLVRRRLERDRKEFLEAILVDSVGWAKTLANKDPKVPISQLQNERLARKKTAVLSVCDPSHFAVLGEVDSLKEMNAADKVACKDRLHAQNPAMP